MEIKRTAEIEVLNARLKHNPVVAILGPRQCGKTTLSRQFAKHLKIPVSIFDLESPKDLNRLDDPLLALEDLKGLVIIDEIQRRPDLFPVLRVLADRTLKTKFLILGSASRELIKQGSETLAGCISYINMGGFTLTEVKAKNREKLWTRGTFPKSFLAPSEKVSYQWRQDFIATFLERDIPNLGLQIPAKSLRTFWTMLAHYHGQIFNASQIAQSLGISDHSAQRYLDLLSGTFMVRQLKPWFYNTKKRIVKRPKIYFSDTGILHALLSLEDKQDILNHPQLGASWEGFAMEETIRHLQLREEEIYFWAVHTGAEMDLVFQKKGKLYGIEVKYNKAPKMTASMRSAISELSLRHLWVIYPGKENYRLSRGATVISIDHCNQIGL